MDEVAALKANQPEPTCHMEDFGEGAKAIKYLSLFIVLSLAYLTVKTLI